MAYISRLSDVVRGVSAGASFQEGLAVRLTAAGQAHPDLPIAELANAGETANVFIVMAAPDNFARPTRAAMYTAGNKVVFDRNSGYSEPIRNLGDQYEVGMSVMWNPTIPSGALALAQRGGTYAVPSGAYVDSANIKVPGNMIKVGSNGKWEYTATTAEAVGYTEEYNTQNAVLIFTLKQ
jgi:hypothetical protein